MDKEKNEMMTSYEKKKRRNLIMLVAVLVVLIAVVFVYPLLKNNKKAEEGSATEEYNLLDINKGDIVNIHYSYLLTDEDEATDDKKVDIGFVFKDKKWFLEGDDNFPVSQSTVNSNLVNGIVDMKVGRKIENPGELDQYGISEDIFKLDITLKDNSVITVTAGKYNEVMTGYYIKTSEDDAVYMAGGKIEEYLYDLYREDPYEYATLDTIPKYSADTLQFISIKNGIGNVELTYKADGVDYDFVNSSYWYFQAPFSRLMPTVDDKIEDCVNIVKGVAYFMLADYEATDEELKEYGITDSDASYSISYYEEIENADGDTVKQLNVFKLEIGKLNTEKECYYVRPILTEGDEITVSRKVSYVDKETIDKLFGIDPLDYMYRYANYISFDNLLNGGYMEITKDDKTYKVEVREYIEIVNGNQEQKRKEYKIDGVVLDGDQKNNFTEFYSEFMKSFVKQIFYDPSMKKEVNPTYTVKYHLVDQPIEEQIVQYTEYDKDFYQVTVDGYTDVLISKEDLDIAFETFDKVFQSK